MARRKRHEEHEEHENHERWLITYADMVTLLMVLFIVMFAMSQVDQKKFEALKQGLAVGVAHSDAVLPGSARLLHDAGAAPTPPIMPNAPVVRPSSLTAGALDGAKNADQATHRRQAEEEAKRLI